jgi:hypothetical protein
MPTVPRIFTRRFEPSLGVIHWRACACVSRVLSAAANCSAGAGRACVQALPLNTCCHDQHLPQALLRKYMPLAVIAGVVLLVLLLRKLLF